MHTCIYLDLDIDHTLTSSTWGPSRAKKTCTPLRRNTCPLPRSMQCWCGLCALVDRFPRAKKTCTSCSHSPLGSAQHCMGRARRFHHRRESEIASARFFRSGREGNAVCVALCNVLHGSAIPRNGGACTRHNAYHDRLRANDAGPCPCLLVPAMY